MVSVRAIQWVGLTFADVDSQGLSRICGIRVVRLSVDPRKSRQKWVGTRRVIRRIREPQDIFIRSDRKPRLVSEVWIVEFLPEHSEKMLAARLVVGKRLAQTFDL